MSELKRFIKHVDQILELAKPIYKEGERAAVYFNLLDKFNIPEEDVEELTIAMIERDCELPSISIYQDKVYTVIISSPWKLDEDGEVIRPERTEEVKIEPTIL